jgi:hypothetical protein
MWMRVVALTLAFLLSSGAGINAQQANSPQPTALLNQALAALSGSAPILDITLTGTVQSIAGSDNETGTGTMKALSSGSNRMDFSLPSGQRTDLRNFGTNPVSGTWWGSDGTAHGMVLHNLLSEPAWFAPVIPITIALNQSSQVVQYVGLEQRNNASVQHLAVYGTETGPSGVVTFYQQLTRFDLYLNPTTLLPVELDYNVHPDTDGASNIPVSVLFSNYQVQNGQAFPMHIQKYLNNCLMLDFQVQTASVNTGLTASTFASR